MYVVYWANAYWLWCPWEPTLTPNWEHDETVTYWLVPNPPGDWSTGL